MKKIKGWWLIFFCSLLTLGLQAQTSPTTKQNTKAATDKIVGIWQLQTMKPESGDAQNVIGIKVFRKNNTFTNYRTDEHENLYPVMNGTFQILTEDTYSEVVSGSGNLGEVLRYKLDGDRLIVWWFNTGKYTSINVGKWIEEVYDRIK